MGLGLNPHEASPMTSPAEQGRAAIADLPQMIRIGAFDMQLRRLTHLEASTQNIHGRFTPLEQSIDIAERPASTHMAIDTVLHEVLHAIWWAGGLKEKDDDEERIVAGFSTGLMQVFRDSPWLLAWMLEWLAPVPLLPQVDISDPIVEQMKVKSYEQQRIATLVSRPEASF
jgi:hypothetical protein